MFNEQNSVENFVRDQLCAGDVGSRRREDNEGREARRTRSTKGAKNAKHEGRCWRFTNRVVL